MAVASAAVTCAAVAPAWASAADRAGTAVIRLPSIPTVTMGAPTVRGAPAAPRMSARAGHETVVETESPGPRAEMIDRGDHSTRQAPLLSVSLSLVRTARGPKGVTTRWPVTGTVASEPDSVTGPGR